MKNATRTLVAVMGTIAGVAGLEHGIGEILQGNTAPARVMFESWPGSPFFVHQAGEPAMSLIPNLLVSGLLTCFIALLFISWCTWGTHRPNPGRILALLSIVLLLVGGGFGPPLLGLVLSATASRIHAPLIWGGGMFSRRLRDFLANLSQWSLGACVLAWLALFPGSNLYTYWSGTDNPMLTPVLFLIAFKLLLLSILTALAHDSRISTQSRMRINGKIPVS